MEARPTGWCGLQISSWRRTLVNLVSLARSCLLSGAASVPQQTSFEAKRNGMKVIFPRCGKSKISLFLSWQLLSLEPFFFCGKRGHFEGKGKLISRENYLSEGKDFPSEGMFGHSSFGGKILPQRCLGYGTISPPDYQRGHPCRSSRCKGIYLWEFSILGRKRISRECQWDVFKEEERGLKHFRDVSGRFRDAFRVFLYHFFAELKVFPGQPRSRRAAP